MTQPQASTAAQPLQAPERAPELDAEWETLTALVGTERVTADPRLLRGPTETSE